MPYKRRPGFIRTGIDSSATLILLAGLLRRGDHRLGQAQVLEALQSVAGIVERRHTLPILANVLLRKNGPTIEFKPRGPGLPFRPLPCAGRNSVLCLL